MKRPAAVEAIPVAHIQERWTPPNWALMERQLFNLLNRAALEFVDRYVRPDGTLIWRKDWPGMDGSDDPYEGFMYLALFYALGGKEEIRDLALKIWEGITWQWTEYGQIHREFDAYYDWMHHGEGYLYFYFLGLADPDSLKNRQRAERFARFYTGDDPEAENYDKTKRLIRSPINGSRGPRFEMTEEDWVTHRGILDDYLPPFEDIPGVNFASRKCPWSDDPTYKFIIQMMNERMAKGDVPLNLNATGLVTNGFMYTGDTDFKSWVLEYLDVWGERTRINGGIIPDNVGLSGEIGECFDGKWWGGYYGWRWPHGLPTLLEPVINAGANAVLLTGDLNHLNFARSQLDKNWEFRLKKGESWTVPYRHFDSGWADYRPADPYYPVYLWYLSMQDEDLERIQRIEMNEAYFEVDIPTVSGGNPKTRKSTKHYNSNTIAWFHYIRGNNPDYPQQILEANYQLIQLQLQKMRSAEGDPAAWITDDFNLGTLSSIHKWQEMCPVYFEGLLQLLLGAPMHISHGGLQHARVRYYDAQAKRPGLPEDVAALVEELSADCVTLSVLNLNLFESRQLIIQAGTFGEHRFEEATVYNEAGVQINKISIEGKWFQVKLEPGAGAKFTIAMRRYVNSPTYQTPWSDPEGPVLIAGRKC